MRDADESLVITARGNSMRTRSSRSCVDSGQINCHSEHITRLYDARDTLKSLLKRSNVNDNKTKENKINHTVR